MSKTKVDTENKSLHISKKVKITCIVQYTYNKMKINESLSKMQGNGESYLPVKN